MINKLLAQGLILLSCAGCIYAPRALSVSGQTHIQTATNIIITQTIPVDPRLANELVGAQAVGIKGDVGSKNTIARPSAKLK